MRDLDGADTHLLVLAYTLHHLLEAGVANNRAEIARRYRVSRARVTEVRDLLKVPEGVQDYIIGLPREKQRVYSRRRLEKIVGRQLLWIGAVNRVRCRLFGSSG